MFERRLCDRTAAPRERTINRYLWEVHTIQSPCRAKPKGVGGVWRAVFCARTLYQPAAGRARGETDPLRKAEYVYTLAIFTTHDKDRCALTAEPPSLRGGVW